MPKRKCVLSIGTIEIEVDKDIFKNILNDFNIKHIVFDNEYCINVSKCYIKTECKYKYKMVKEIFLSETNNLSLLEIRGY